jgi:hypothetical protein
VLAGQPGQLAGLASQRDVGRSPRPRSVAAPLAVVILVRLRDTEQEAEDKGPEVGGTIAGGFGLADHEPRARRETDVARCPPAREILDVT